MAQLIMAIFSVSGYLTLIRKEKDLFLETPLILNHVFEWLKCLTSFSSLDHFFFLMHSF